MSSEITEETDYYELLECEPDCSQEELKKAYRKAALKWHPDRNFGNKEEATRVFQLIEHAYSILSDDHERAWYDGHRNLSTDPEGQVQVSKVNIMSLFHACAYFGFNENSNGFYPVFRKAFSTLAEEENADAPPFGNADTPWEQVREFYAYWTCFKTKRSFAFADLYRLKDAPNSMYRRAMKQDNEKARQKAEQEFVASVRELAQYVQKRDPRVIQHQKEVAEQRELKEAEEQAKKEARRQQILEELNKYENEGPKIEYNEDDLIYVHQFDNDNQKEIDKWSCPFCKREIKTESAFKAHCNTKKHQKAAANQKRNFLQNPSLFDHTAKTFVLLCMTPDEIKQIIGDAEIDLDHLDDEDDFNFDDQNEEEEDEEEDDVRPKRQLSKKDIRRMKKKEETMAAAMAATNKKADAQKQRQMSKKEKRKQQIIEEKAKKEQQMKDERKAKMEVKEEKNKQRQLKEQAQAQLPTEESQPERKLSKKEIRRMKQKEALEALNEQEKQHPDKPLQLPKNIKNPPPGMFMCRKCRLLFPSKRKLFDHLKESGHAIAE